MDTSTLQSSNNGEQRVEQLPIQYLTRIRAANRDRQTRETIT